MSENACKGPSLLGVYRLRQEVTGTLPEDNRQGILYRLIWLILFNNGTLFQAYPLLD